MSKSLQEYISINKQDAIIFKASALIKEADGDLWSLNMILIPIAKMLSNLKSEMLLESYTKVVSKLLDVQPKVLTNLIKEDSDKQKQEESVQYLGENQKALQKWINKDFYYAHGFDMLTDEKEKQRTGIYFARGNKEADQLTNFTITPLVHVFSADDSNRRLAEVNNGYIKEVIELPSRAWSSADMFETTLMDKGVFYCNDGFAKSHLNKLKSVLLPKFTKCWELNNLGWQSEGFFAYSNCIYKDGIRNFDEYGVATVDDKRYLSMGASKALAGLRDQESDYTNDKYLKYIKTDLNFSGWTELMMDAYLEKGMMGACFAIMAAYKDIIFKRNNNCPLPYCFGPAQSGKSKFGESIASLFTFNMPALNLNQTTEFALWERLGLFKNVLSMFNEFDEKSIREEFTRAFKGAFDGEGRNRGTGRKGKTQTQPINCLVMLLGQYLTTSDDGAILQRTIPVKFVEDNNRSDFQQSRFQELKDLEKIGITSISAELFQYRSYVSDNFTTRFYDLSKKMKLALAKENVTAKTRIVENYVNGMTVTSLIGDKISMAFSMDDFFEYCKKQIISLSLIISETNALASFWKTIEYLVDRELIEQGYDFKVETKSEIKVSSDVRNETVTKTFTEPKKLLFLRFDSVHHMYLKEFKNVTNKPGMDSGTVKSYMKDQDSYIGSSPSSTFKTKSGKSTVTSSYVFDYELLKVNLERSREEDETREEVTLVGKLQYDAKIIDVLNQLKLSINLVEDQSYFKAGKLVEKKVYTQCYTNDLKDEEKLKKGVKITMTGLLSEKQTADKIKRTLIVNSMQIIKEEDGDKPEATEKMQF